MILRTDKMKAGTRQSGFTLMEQTVVVACIAILIVLGLPAGRAFVKSFESQGSTRAMISAAMASARAIAAKEQHYTGIRFQQKYQQDGKGCQYIIFIVHDFDNTGLANGFRAVEGIEPIKLPETVGAVEVVGSDSDIDDDDEVTDKTTFSIIFSPSGKLVIHEVRVRNRDGKYQPSNPLESQDDIFNSPENIKDHNIGMFIQDDYADRGLGAEPSRNSFIIYDRNIFEKLNESRRWSDYLEHLDVTGNRVYINPYTGTMIEK
jgi:Tfp pilus assembly protein FimT